MATGLNTGQTSTTTSSLFPISFSSFFANLPSTTVITTTTRVTTGGQVVTSTITTTSTISSTLDNQTTAILAPGPATASTDLTKSVSSSTSTQSPTSAHHTSRHAAASTPTSSPASNGDGGLSTGAAIGIGVAISVFAIAVLLALGFFWYRRRSRRRRQGDRDATGPERDDQRDVLGAATTREKTKPDDATVVSPYELSGKSRTGELETSANRHELDARNRAERRHELQGDYGERKGVQYSR